MSVLDTFFVLFKADTTELKKGTDTAGKLTDDFQSKLKATDKAAEHLGHSFSSAMQSAAGLFAGILSVGTILGSIKSAVSYVEEIGDASRKLDVDPTKLDAWGHAVQRTGGSAREFQSSLSSLATHLGTTNAIALKALPSLADNFKRLNNFQALRLGKHLGLDQSTIFLLQKGRREVEDIIKQQDKLGLVTKEQIEITRKFDNALYDAGRAYQSFVRELIIPVLPGITKTFEYLEDHKDLVKGAFLAIGSAAFYMGRGFLFSAKTAKLLKKAVGILAVASAYEEVKNFYTGEKDTAIAHIVGSPNFQEFRKKNDEWADKLPSFVQKLIGHQAPDYATGSNKQLTLNTGPITINTQATDAQGVAGGFIKALGDQFQQTVNFFDNNMQVG